MVRHHKQSSWMSSTYGNYIKQDFNLRKWELEMTQTTKLYHKTIMHLLQNFSKDELFNPTAFGNIGL